MFAHAGKHQHQQHSRKAAKLQCITQNTKMLIYHLLSGGAVQCFFEVRNFWHVIAVSYIS